MVTPDELRKLAPHAHVQVTYYGELADSGMGKAWVPISDKLFAAADAWERTLKIVEARPDDPYPDEELGLSEEAHQWVQEIWRMSRIHQADAIKLRQRLEAAEKPCYCCRERKRKCDPGCRCYDAALAGEEKP